MAGNRHFKPVCESFEQHAPIRADYLADQIQTPCRFDKIVKRRGKEKVHITQIGLVKVKLPFRYETLTMIVCRLTGRDKPMMLLTNLSAENYSTAQRVLRLYIRRWECEEAIHFLKSQVNLEKIRTFNWIAICRLVLLDVLVMIFLSWLIEEHPQHL